MMPSKSALRVIYKAQRDALSAAERLQENIAIREAISFRLKEGAYEGLLGFVPFGTEPDLFPLYKSMSIRIFFPRTRERSIMDFFEWKVGESLIPGRHGIGEPASSAPAFDPNLRGLLLVPALAIDAEGYRLGYGGGYYDRFLARFPRIDHLGICFSHGYCESLPHEVYDFKLKDWTGKAR